MIEASTSIVPTAKAFRRSINAQPLEVARNPDALLTLKTAVAISGLSEPTLYRKAKTDPKFPRFVKMGKRCTRIRAGDLIAWLALQQSPASDIKIK